MLSLANVLHQTSRSKEAAVVLEAALTYNNSISDLYFTLGHALAVRQTFVMSLDSDIFVRPNYDQIMTYSFSGDAEIRCISGSLPKLSSNRPWIFIGQYSSSGCGVSQKIRERFRNSTSVKEAVLFLFCILIIFKFIFKEFTKNLDGTSVVSSTLEKFPKVARRYDTPRCRSGD